MRTRLTGIGLLLLTFSAWSKAGMIDVTSSPSIDVPQGATVEFGFNISNFAHNSAGYSPYPTSLNFQLFGLAGSGQPSASLPGSSQQYDPQYLLDATLASADGSSWVPLVNSAATRLSLKAGSMVVTPGVLQSSQSTNVNLINASVRLTPQQSASIFGPDIASASNLAYVILHNDGPDILLGIGAGYDLRSAMIVSGVTGAAPVSTGGSVRQAGFEAASAAPEPSTYVNLAGASAMLLAFQLFRRCKKLKPETQAAKALA